MSLKFFFMSLTEDELEFICHHYVHNWINEELQNSNRLLSKYQVEQKLEYINSKGTGHTSNKSSIAKSTSQLMVSEVSKYGLDAVPETKKIPSYMAPTIVKVQKLHDQLQSDPKEFQDQLRGSSQVSSRSGTLQKWKTGNADKSNGWKPSGHNIM